MNKMQRAAGILFPIASLPSRHGVGAFDKTARKFVDELSKAGYKIWQILPLNPLGYGHSPYQPFSSYAMDELYVDLDALYEQGLIARAPDYMKDSDRIAYEELRLFKMPYLKRAFRNDTEEHGLAKVDEFMDSHPFVKDYARFMAYKRKHDMISWQYWSEEEKAEGLSRPEPQGDFRKDYYFEAWLQMVLYAQYEELHEYAKSKGVAIMGDVPYYVGYDSCDVYSAPDLFLLDPETKQPTSVAGVPPDYFSATGQRWGNPIYDWEKMRETGFAFLNERLSRNGRLYDILRLDHFRAFDTYWKIPATCPTAVEGEWLEAPGEEFFEQFIEKYPDVSIVAEDLGDLRPEVLVLRDEFDFPGMNVLEFNFPAYINQDGKWEDKENMVAYIGTHDNETAKGFFDAMGEEERARWEETLKKEGYEGSLTHLLIEFLLSLKAKWAIVSLSDLLEHDNAARLNVPGVVDGINWTYREKDFAKVAKAIKASAPLLKKHKRL